MSFQNISVNPIISKNFDFCEVTLRYSIVRIAASSLEWWQIVANRVPSISQSTSQQRRMQTFRPRSQTNLEVLKKKLRKTWRFQNMRQIKTTTTDYLFQSFLCLISALCCILLLLFLQSWVELKVAQNSFQHLYFDGSLQPLFITWCYNHGIKTLPNHWWTRCYHFRDTIGYHSNSITC